jgi:hypothetical protein
VTLAAGVSSRRVQCVACGDWHVVADVAASMLARDAFVVCPSCGSRVACPKAAHLVRCDPTGQAGCGRLFAGPAQLIGHRAAIP